MQITAALRNSMSNGNASRPVHGWYVRHKRFIGRIFCKPKAFRGKLAISPQRQTHASCHRILNKLDKLI